MTMVRPLAMVMPVSISRTVSSGESIVELVVFLIASDSVCVTSSVMRSVLVICGVSVRMMPVSSYL